MPNYTPFEKELNDLAADDLIALTQASEGWYIEYKRDVPLAPLIAKSISAFANTYGGWLFYGIMEKSKEDPVAGEFPGISKSELDAYLQRIRQAVASHMVPEAHFDIKVLNGPCAKIGLSENRAILCIQIRRSHSAPHVHKSGQIYRRVADGSEPKAENDRFVLDQLWKRSKEFGKSYKKWIKRKPEFSKAEKERPYARLLLVSDLWQDRGTWIDADLEELRKCFSTTEPLIMSLPFDNVYDAGNCIIARQLKNNDPQNLGLTWRLYRDLSSEIIIPFNFWVADQDVRELITNLRGYENAVRFISILQSGGYKYARVVDFNYLFNILSGIAEIQRRLMVKANWKEAYFVKARLLNVWRTIPFLDVSTVLDDFEKNGMPMCLDSDRMSPGGTDPESFAEVMQFSDVEGEHAPILLDALSMFAPLANAFGIPGWREIGTEAGDEPYFQKLRDAGNRATENQRLRNT